MINGMKFGMMNMTNICPGHPSRMSDADPARGGAVAECTWSPASWWVLHVRDEQQLVSEAILVICERSELG